MLDWCGFRIGTLFEYRSAEKYAGQTLDPEEGLSRHKETLVEGNASQISPYSRMWIDGDPEALANVQIENFEFQSFLTEVNHYIYCASLSPSWDGDVDPNYDVCIEIVHVAAFLSVLSDCLVKRGLTQVLLHGGNVEYIGRAHVTVTNRGVTTGGSGVRPALLKPASFGWQREYRALYTPITRDVNSVVANDPRIRKLVKRHSTRPNI